MEASGVVCQSREGTPLTNPAYIYVLTLRAGENTRDVLRNVALLTLGGSVWSKRWHHGGRCFSVYDRRGSHIPPTAAALATVTAAFKIELSPGLQWRGVASIPPPFAVNDSDVDIDFRCQGKLETVAALKGEGDDGVGGCTFNYLIEVTPPLFIHVYQQAFFLQR